MNEPPTPEILISEQIDYYRARAREYDEWWERLGRYDRGPDENARWFAERAQILAALDGMRLRGDVLELPPGPASGPSDWRGPPDLLLPRTRRRR
jgi:hypothetical protein